MKIPFNIKTVKSANLIEIVSKKKIQKQILLMKSKGRNQEIRMSKVIERKISPNKSRQQ